jgi:peroxiredoxin
MSRWSRLARGVRGAIEFLRHEVRMLKPGDEAPDFRLSDHEGRNVCLSETKGRRKVLWFYPMASTPG